MDFAKIRLTFHRFVEASGDSAPESDFETSPSTEVDTMIYHNGV
jgi:hypothetical protein